MDEIDFRLPGGGRLIIRDVNENDRFDPDVDEVLYEGVRTHPSRSPRNVTPPGFHPDARFYRDVNQDDQFVLGIGSLERPPPPVLTGITGLINPRISTEFLSLNSQEQRLLEKELGRPLASIRSLAHAREVQMILAMINHQHGFGNTLIVVDGILHLLEEEAQAGLPELRTSIERRAERIAGTQFESAARAYLAGELQDEAYLENIIRFNDTYGGLSDETLASVRSRFAEERMETIRRDISSAVHAYQEIVRNPGAATREDINHALHLIRDAAAGEGGNVPYPLGTTAMDAPTFANEARVMIRHLEALRSR